METPGVLASPCRAAELGFPLETLLELADRAGDGLADWARPRRRALLSAREVATQPRRKAKPGTSLDSLRTACVSSLPSGRGS